MMNQATAQNEIYIANCTLQNRIFQYRVSESARQVALTIKIGTQVKLPGQLTGMEVAYIEKKARKYGLRRIDEIKHLKDFAGLVMSVGKPVPLGPMGDTIEHNRDVLKERGKELRKEAAVAAAQTVSGENPQIPIDPNVKLGALEVEIVEQEKPGKDTEINETIRVTNSQEEASIPDRGGRKGGRRRS